MVITMIIISLITLTYKFFLSCDLVFLNQFFMLILNMKSITSGSEDIYSIMQSSFDLWNCVEVHYMIFDNDLQNLVRHR